MDICHASISPLTFEQEHKFLQAIKTSHRSTYKKCNFKVDHQVLKNLSQEKSYGYLLQGKSTSFFFKSKVTNESLGFKQIVQSGNSIFAFEKRLLSS